ncbi:MAG: hypothetical protein KDD78_09965 [Caldilineaceae bacterium]|nr:hypothetical protein [Caldilineaceae bacterium]
MINVIDNDTGTLLGTISEDQLAFLVAQLEEESSSDRDYYINRPTLALFEQRGADAPLMDLLRTGMGDRDEMEIRWTRA